MEQITKSRLIMKVANLTDLVNQLQLDNKQLVKQYQVLFNEYEKLQRRYNAVYQDYLELTVREDKV